MLQKEIKVGGLYRAKVSNKLTTVRVDEISKRDSKGPYRRGGMYYVVTNTATGRQTTFRSAAKFRSVVGG